MLYAIKNASDYTADYVLENGNKTYLCSLNPNEVDHTSNTPIEDQPVWKIQLIETVTVNGKNITRTKYPNGMSSAYIFAASDCETLTYEYQK